MKSIRTWSPRKIFWAGVVVIILVVGGRIAWVMYASRDTGFMVLGESYQPKWKNIGTLTAHSGTHGHSEGSHICQSLPPFEERITQELARDSFGDGSLYGRAEWVATVWVESTMRKEHWLTMRRAYDIRSTGKCRVLMDMHYDIRSRVLELNVSEGFRGQAREVALFFKLTPDGFVHIEDKEEK